ncbi:MAG TPA: hypothetical protein VGH38_20695 [Bryobacteraceae bacterium]
MLYNALLAVTYLCALLGIGYLFWRVGRRRSKKVEVAAKAEPEHANGESSKSKPEPVPSKKSKGKGKGKAPAEAAPEKPGPVLHPLVPQPEVFEVEIPGSDLRYYKPFGPSDSIFDVWMKFQTLTSTEPITARIIPSEDNTPIVQSAIPPDGTVYGSAEAFREDFASGIRRNSGPSVWRAVRALSSFGIPPSAAEGAYHFSTATLHMELKGVQIMDVSFVVRATFEPNLGLIPAHFAERSDYLHCEMSTGEVSNRGRGEKTMVKVGFPWTFTGITLHSEDPRLEEEGSKIVKAITSKYARHVKQDEVATPSAQDPTRRISVISDGMVVIAIMEGTAKSRFLQIQYSPAPRGPLDESSVGDADFVSFAKWIREREERRIQDEQETAVNTPF